MFSFHKIKNKKILLCWNTSLIQSKYGKKRQTRYFSFDTVTDFLYFSSVAEMYGLKIVAPFCGHGIGDYFHGPPDIFHFG